MRNKYFILGACLVLFLALIGVTSLSTRALAIEPEAEEVSENISESLSSDSSESDDPQTPEISEETEVPSNPIDEETDSDEPVQEVDLSDEGTSSTVIEESSDSESLLAESVPSAVPLVVESQSRISGSIKAMYRLYNPNSGEHFYTASVAEARSLISVGWDYEGVGWVAPASSGSPVYRLYNPNAGDHHYTLSAAERDSLVGVGWRYEGVGWYSDDARTVPLYRQYNPNARAGAHNFTTSQEERDGLVAVGWRDEGTGWYGVGTGADDPGHGLFTRTPIIASATSSSATMASYFRSMTYSYPSDVYSKFGAATIDDFCRIAYEEATAEGVDPAILFAQVLVESNYFKFGDGISASQCNFGCLGVTGSNKVGSDFSSYGSDAVRMGLRAQVQHLKAYATDAPLKNACVDSGYGAVSKGCAPYLEYFGSGNWSGDRTYASKIVKVLDAYAPTYTTSSESQYSAVYNFEFYRSKFPDLARTFGDDRDAMLSHFLTFGVKERRQACATFSVQSYYNQYEDVRRAYGTDMLAICRHYIQYGKSEGRAGTGCTSLQGSWQYHNIAWAGQPNGYYCGPTSGYMILRNVGATRSASGTSLTIYNVASYMGTTTSGTSFANRAFANGMNRWLGKNVYTTVHTPSYATVRSAILNSYSNGYAAAVDTQERRGGPHLNGHGNTTFSHIMVVDAYNQNSDTVTIVDPGAGTVWSGSAQKFNVNLNYLVTQFMQQEVFFDREHIGLHYAR